MACYNLLLKLTRHADSRTDEETDVLKADTKKGNE